MTQEQWQYEAAQAKAQHATIIGFDYLDKLIEAYYDYLDKLIENKQYQLYAINIAEDMLNSKEFINSGMSFKDWLYKEKKRLEAN